MIIQFPRSVWLCVYVARRFLRHFAVVVVATTLLGCNKEKPPGTAGVVPPPPPPPPEVLVTPVVQQDVPVYSEWLGTTDGSINAQIRSRVQGYLQARHYREGVFVKTGDLLFSIDPRPYQAALDQAKGDLGRAEAVLGKTRLDVARYTPLAKEGAISQQELDNAIQADRGNQAAVAAARAAVRQAELNLEWTQVKSPIDGIAGISVAQIGDLISANTLLTTVSRVDPMKVTFPMSEREYLGFADRIGLAMQAEKRAQQHGPPIELILADGHVYPERGEFALPDREVDLKTGTITIVSYFPNPKGILRPGLYAKVRAVTDQKTAALLVPQRAVQELQGTRRVAIVNAEKKVEFRVVKASTRVGTLWVIDEGLTPTDQVVVEGLQKVRDGVPVIAKPAPIDPSMQGAVAAAVPPTSPPASATKSEGK